MKDGSVMLGGGFNQYGDVGCENTDVRLFYPPYLSSGAAVRPVAQVADGTAVEPGQKSFVISYKHSGKLHPTKPVALLAVSAFTHR